MRGQSQAVAHLAAQPNGAAGELAEAQLGGAHLEGASLLGVTDLDQARLDGAIADDATVWPEGFRPRAAGVIGISAGG